MKLERPSIQDDGQGLTDGASIVVIGGARVMIDTADWERLKHLPWRAGRQSHRIIITRQTGASNGKRRNVYIYQDILGVTAADGWVDHANGDHLDNRRCNLRICTPAQNCMNRAPVRGKAVPYKGVVKLGVRFQVSIRRRKIGNFDTAREAALAYDAAAKLAFGDFAWLNSLHFPELADTQEQDHA